MGLSISGNREQLMQRIRENESEDEYESSESQNASFRKKIDDLEKTVRELREQAFHSTQISSSLQERYDATQRINELNVRGSNENVATLKLHGNQRLDQDATSRKQIEHQSAHLPNDIVATYRQQNDLIGSRPSNDNVATSQLHGFENVATAQQQNGLLRHSHENVASTQQHSAYINSRMYHTNATTDKLYDNNNVATLQQQNGSNMPIKNVVTFQPPERENVATFRQHYVHVDPQMSNEQMRNENYNHGNIPNRQYQEYYPPRFNDNSQWSCARHVSAYGHVKEMLALIPDFNPTSDKSLSPQQFIRRIGNLRNTYGWDDQTLIFGVQQKMQGAARYWIDTINDVVQTWPEFVQRFLDNFPHIENAADIHITMSKTRRAANESPQEYYYKMYSMGKKGELTDSEISTHIINGINDYDLKRKISNKYFVCKDLLTDILMYGAHNDIRHNSTNLSKRVPNVSTTTTGQKSMAVQNNEKNDKVSVPVTLNGFGGGKYFCTKMLTAKLKIDGNVFITDTLIVGDNLIKENVMLGQDILCRKGDNLIKENVMLGQDILCRKGSKLVIEGEECVLENVNEITTGNDLNELQQQRVNEVVQRNEQCFADEAKDLGKCSIAKMEIKLTTDVPVSIKPYRTPFALRPVVINMISELLEADIIRQSDSPYASGIVM
ncbi:hypothetical protein ACLKA6_018686, partial [Drosophila palustris]